MSHIPCQYSYKWLQGQEKIPLLNKTQWKRLVSWSIKPWIKRSLAQSWEHTVQKKSQILLEYGPADFFTTWKTLLMSLISKSKANSSAAECRTAFRIQLSWRKEDAHTRPGAELRASSAPRLPTGHLAAPSPCPSSLHSSCSKGSSHELCQAQGHTNGILQAAHLTYPVSDYSVLHYMTNISGFYFVFLCFSWFFLFQLIAKDCIETLWNHRALCHITKQTTCTKNIALHPLLLCLCSILFNFFLHHKAAAALMEVSLISDTAILYTDNGSGRAQRNAHCSFPVCTGQTPLGSNKQGA